jgi:NAD(P)-dependent dehydrogenase (short-subunit alcohol dehydrogenase family)
MAEAFVEAGAHVVLMDTDLAAARATAQALGRAEALHLDAADRDAQRAAFADIARRHGRLDIAVANAGMSAGPGYITGAGRLAAVEDARWDAVLELNLTGVFATVQAACGLMEEAGQGSVILVSSIAGMRADPMVGYAYAATKAAVANLTRQAAMEFAPRGVRVNAIAPGPFRTNIAGGRIHVPENEAAFAGTVPMGRIGEPDEIKGLALLLASDAGSYITGAVIPVDGGTTAR